MIQPRQLGFGFDQIEEEKATAHLPSEMEAGIAHYRGMLEQHDAAMIAGDGKRAMAIREEANKLAYKLNGNEPGILAGPEAPGYRLMDGMLGACAGLDVWPNFSAKVIDPDKPSLSETGYRSFIGTSFRRIAEELNQRDFRTGHGNRRHASTVRPALSRMPQFQKARKDEGKISFVPYSPLNDLQDRDTPSIANLSAGRRFAIEGGHMPINIPEGERMIDVFALAGAREFVVTKLDLNQELIWAKTYSAGELRGKLPAMMRTAERRESIVTPDHDPVMAGENLIVRPKSAEVTFVQLDDLSKEQLDRIRPACFLIISTSPGNYQAWMSVSGVAKTESKEFIRRARRAVGSVDQSASGATRVAGSENFKLKYAPEFPVVTITYAMPGRVMTPGRLQEMGLVAEPGPARISAAPARVSRGYDRPWPAYQITLSRTRPRKDGSGPDRSLADFNWAMTCCTGGKSVEDTIARLLEVSENARERAERGDTGYARIAVENAAAAVARNWARNRA